MKKPINFNAIEFARVLRDAQGNRTQKDFAADAGISTVHLSNMLRAKITALPNKTTLQRIADVAENNITMDDLLASIEFSDVFTPYIESTVRGIILNALFQCACDFTPIKNATDFDYGLLSCNIKSATIDIWQFRLITLPLNRTDTTMPSNHLTSILRNEMLLVSGNDYHCITDHLTTHLFTHPKVTFAFVDERAYDYFYENIRLPSLNLLLSAILIDVENFCIIKENYLQTGISPDTYQSDETIIFK